MNLNKKNNNRYVITPTTIFTLAIMTTTMSSMMTSSVPVAQATTTATTTTTSPEEPGIIQLSPEPVYREVHTPISRTPINETHFQVPISGNGTITLPNTTETISVTSTGSYLSSLDGTALGKEVITTEDGSESATAKIYGIAQLEERRGIIIAVFDTNSTTGRLAPLDGMILAGQIEYPPEETVTLITLWEWQGGVPLPTGTTPPEESPSPMNTTTTTTTANATTASDTNTTGTASEEQGEGEQQQCQLELRTDGDTFGLGDSVTITLTNGGDEALKFSNSILGLEIENQDTGEAYPLFSAQAIITLEPGESRTTEFSYEVLVNEIGTGTIEASVSSDDGCLASTTFTLA
jgi:hypothetical protein